jgi:ATP-binding cassette, subfamily B, bacterial PglK
MQPNQSLIYLLRRLWLHISPLRRVQFGFLLVLMILASFAEIISIGAVLPFLGVLTAPNHIFEHSAAQPIIQFFELTSAEQLLLPLTIAFGLAALFAGIMRLLLLWTSTRLSFNTGADLSFSIYQRTLYQPYVVHIARNSSEIINGISSKTGAVIGVVMMMLTLISSSVMLIAILFALLAIEPGIALATFGGFGLIYGFIIWITKNRQSINSKRNARETTRVIKYIQEGLGGIRDILLDGSQPAYCKIYQNANLALHRAQSSSVFISAFPRYGVEALGMVFIAALAYFLAQQSDGIAKVIPVLGALALGAQRLLPVLQQSYSAWSSIQANQVSLQDALELLDQPLPDYANKPVPAPLPFKKQIKLNQLSFRYDTDTPWILNNINLKIVKGSRVGFIGTTGSGKSTLLDILMGFLLPTEGTIEVDGQVVTPTNHRAWQTHIAHVPQSIFLSDGTIEENIALGVPKDQIDHKRVKKSAYQAQISDTIGTWQNKYETIVGERGVKLSGGQRQRIGIARALYKQTDVIIFDEATSALDSETENAIVEAIESLSEDLTILVIAHRLSTLKNCTQIVELGDGGIVRVDTYQDLIKLQPDLVDNN